MFVRLGQILMIAALLTISGAQWAALQSVAWTAMLAKNLHSGSLSQAIDKTFDGRYPCPLCRAIAAGKADQKKAEFTLDLKKFEFPPATERLAFIAPARFWLLPLTDAYAAAFSQQPPVPPPRGLFA